MWGQVYLSDKLLLFVYFVFIFNSFGFRRHLKEKPVTGSVCKMLWSCMLHNYFLALYICVNGKCILKEGKYFRPLPEKDEEQWLVKTQLM